MVSFYGNNASRLLSQFAKQDNNFEEEEFDAEEELFEHFGIPD